MITDTIRMEEKIEKVLDDVRPSLALHEGDVRLVGYNHGVVRLELKGSCVGCSMSTVTLSMGIQKALQEKLPEVTKVVQVDDSGKDIPSHEDDEEGI